MASVTEYSLNRFNAKRELAQVGKKFLETDGSFILFYFKVTTKIPHYILKCGQEAR